MWNNDFKYNLSLLTKYEFLDSFSGDLYEINENNNIDEIYFSFLNPKKDIENNKKSYWDLHIDEKENSEENHCNICGKVINDIVYNDICSDCFNKQLIIEDLNRILEYISPGTEFSKSDLINKGFSDLELDIIFSNLKNEDLIVMFSDDIIFLVDSVKLNEFIKKYSDSDDEILLSSEYNKNNKLVLDKDSLNDEKSLDSYIDFMDYQNFVHISFDFKSNLWKVELKENNLISSTKFFSNSFEAKLEALNYLNQMNIVKVLSDNVLTKENNYENNDNYLTKNDNLECNICVVCGSHFEPKSSNSSDIYCNECKKKYTYSELSVIRGINEGIYDKNIAIKIMDLRKKGKTNKNIGKMLNIRSSLIPTILKLLYPNVKGYSEVNNDNNNKYNVCAICGNNFSSLNSSKMYCKNCKSKYKPIELVTLKKIKQGKITKDLAIKINDLKEKGMSNVEIARKLKIQNNLIPSILKFLLSNNKDINIDNNYADNKVTGLKDSVCVVCGSHFEPKSSNSSDIYCNECKKKYTYSELSVIRGINEGIYDESTAIDIYNLYESNYTFTDISKELGIPTLYLKPILKFLLPIFYNSKDFAMDNSEFNVVYNINGWLLYYKKKLIGIFNSKNEALNYGKNYLLQNSIKFKKVMIIEESTEYSKIILRGFIKQSEYFKILSLILSLITNNELIINYNNVNKYEDGFNIIFNILVKYDTLNYFLSNLKQMNWSKTQIIQF